MAPVGMVAAVSMKTAAKRNMARLAGSCGDRDQRELGGAEEARACWPTDGDGHLGGDPAPARPSEGQPRTPPIMSP